MKRVHIYISDEAARKLRRVAIMTGIKPSQLFEEMIDIEIRAVEAVNKIKYAAAERLKKEEAKAVAEFVKERMERHKPEEEEEDGYDLD